MAIAFARVAIHSRAQGHSAVAASAYRTASRLYDERTGETHDYTHRTDVVYTKLVLPAIAHTDFSDREYLWNQAEFAEKRRDAQVCKDLVLALPRELELSQQIMLAKRFAQKHYIDHGIPADIAIHDNGTGNPHAHILTATRRLERNGFSRHKARDLNPVFAKGKIVENDVWGERWRDCQNDFFIENNIPLTVDANHIIAERHQGKTQKNHYIQAENQWIRETRQQLCREHTTGVLEHLRKTHSVFTRQDIEKLLFKTFQKSDTPEQYLGLVEKVMAHPDVIPLGQNDRGQMAFTTKNQYVREAKLRSDVEKMMQRHRQVRSYAATLQNLAQSYALSTEQETALSYLAQAPDIAVLIGKPGTGKSYVLQPVKDYFVSRGNIVMGAALSGKVSKSLQQETGIASSTIASLVYRLENKKLKLSKQHVLVIDEAGMIDVDNMAYILRQARKAGSKVILVGDPEQLKPIHKGEILRGIAAITGYIELENIQRQHDMGDRAASLAMAKGDMAAGVMHYHSKGGLRFGAEREATDAQLITDWKKSITTETLQDNIILAFTRAAVADLNHQARGVLQDQGILGKEAFVWQGHEGKLEIATQERLLFRQNDKTIGVRNGDVGTVTHCDHKSMTVKLDSGEQVIIPKTYTALDYGYALTIHKAQGMTAKNVYAFIDSKYWDRNLAFVAMTRHKETLKLYADRIKHPNLEDVIKTVSRNSIRDNVLDWPLDFAIRTGFNPEKMVGKALNSLAGVGHRIKDAFDYVVHYDAYMQQQKNRSNLTEKQHQRTIAHQFAEYWDMRNTVQQDIVRLDKIAKAQGVDKSKIAGFEEVYQKTLIRDRMAYSLLTIHKPYCENLKPHHTDKLHAEANRYERYLAVKTIAENSASTEKQIIASARIDLSKDYVHIVREAPKNQMTPSALYARIESLQKQHCQQKFHALKQEHPVLQAYEELRTKRAYSSGYDREQCDKAIAVKARSIMEDKKLRATLQQELPQWLEKIKGVGKDVGRER